MLIILKILLYVLLAVLGVILAVLILALALPITAEVDFTGGKLKYKVKFAFISLMNSDGSGFLKKFKKKNKNPEPEEDIPDSDPYNSDNIYDIDIQDIENEDDIEIDIPVYEDIEDDEYNDMVIDEIDDENSDSEEKERSEKIRKIKEKKSVKDTPEEEEKENPLLDKIEFLINIWDIAGRPLLKIFRGFHIKKVYIDFIVANEDAYKCAVNYGIISGAVYNLLAWLGELFTVSYKTVDIRSGFSLKKSQWDASCKVDFRLYTLVISILWFLIVYQFKISIPKKRGQKKSGK